MLWSSLGSATCHGLKKPNLSAVTGRHDQRPHTSISSFVRESRYQLHPKVGLSHEPASHRDRLSELELPLPTFHQLCASSVCGLERLSSTEKVGTGVEWLCRKGSANSVPCAWVWAAFLLLCVCARVCACACTCTGEFACAHPCTHVPVSTSLPTKPRGASQPLASCPCRKPGHVLQKQQLTWS